MDTPIRRLDSRAVEFDRALSELIAWEEVSDSKVNQLVIEILAQVKTRGDEALLEFSNRFDRRSLEDASELVMDAGQIAEASAGVDAKVIEALEEAARRIRDFHQRQLQESWSYKDEFGNLLGQQINPLARVGLYVPGGKAAYPSSVLMNAIPAKVAGVNEILMVTPLPDSEINPVVFAAARVAGIDRVVSIGGAQAIAAMAYGTETVPAVDKIVGPGNIYVATAKKMLFGTVGLDMIAGPSEILVICDGQTSPDWIAMDLFSQSEHDVLAQAILISPDLRFLDQVQASINRLLPQMERASTIERSLLDRGALIHVADLDTAMDIANRIAPEHLELSVADAEQWLPRLRNAGAVFLGRYTPEAFGDYCAGPNHVLPTSTTARFSSPLGVYDFQKRTSILGCSASGAQQLAGIASTLAQAEGLTAHAKSAEMRMGQ